MVIFVLWLLSYKVDAMSRKSKGITEHYGTAAHKEAAGRPGSLLKPFIVNRTTLAWLPRCEACGKPILDFSAGNLVLEGSGEPAGPPERIEGYTLQPIDGRPVALHAECDDRRRKPWVRMNAVLRSEQRGERDLVLRGSEGEQVSHGRSIGPLSGRCSGLIN
jgi:hypothetical protein